jgi:hypothetical protein
VVAFFTFAIYTMSSWPGIEVDDFDADDDYLSHQCRRFRILVMGKAGVGKSTLLSMVFGVPPETVCPVKWLNARFPAEANWNRWESNIKEKAEDNILFGRVRFLGIILASSFMILEALNRRKHQTSMRFKNSLGNELGRMP